MECEYDDDDCEEEEMQYEWKEVSKKKMMRRGLWDEEVESWAIQRTQF